MLVGRGGRGESANAKQNDDGAAGGAAAGQSAGVDRLDFQEQFARERAIARRGLPLVAEIARPQHVLRGTTGQWAKQLLPSATTTAKAYFESPDLHTHAFALFGPERKRESMRKLREGYRTLEGGMQVYLTM